MPLTVLQEKAFKLMEERKNVFITGAAGTGKSLIICKFRDTYRNVKNIAVTSTTGVSAVILGGSTLHSYTGIGFGTGSVESLYDKIMNSKAKQRWKRLEVLIIDEISMMSPELFDKIEQLARLIRRNEFPFGGIQVVATGDFCQLCPVDSDDKLCFESEGWKRCKFTTVVLTENMRQRDNKFQLCLNEIRMGSLTGENLELIKSLVGKKLESKNGILPTVIKTTNADVDIVNEREIEKLRRAGEQSYTYEMEIEVFGKDKSFLENKYRKACVATPELTLCVNAQVMLIYNMDLENGLCNGSRGVVVKFIEKIPVVRFLNGQECIVDFQTWNYEEEDVLVASITQIPLKIAYAVTTHKIQGCSLDYCIVNLRNIFAYSQIYIGLSRARTLDGLSIEDIDIKSISTHPKALEFYKTHSSDEKNE